MECLKELTDWVTDRIIEAAVELADADQAFIGYVHATYRDDAKALLDQPTLKAAMHHCWLAGRLHGHRNGMGNDRSEAN